MSVMQVNRKWQLDATFSGGHGVVYVGGDLAHDGYAAMVHATRFPAGWRLGRWVGNSPPLAVIAAAKRAIARWP